MSRWTRGAFAQEPTVKPGNLAPGDSFATFGPYMQVAMEHLNAGGMKISPEDMARLSPLQHKHINVLGHYSFALDDPIAQGELRLLNIGGWDDNP